MSSKSFYLLSTSLDFVKGNRFEFRDFERRFQEKLDRMREENEREKAYPLTQRMQDMSKRMDAKMKEEWEKDKKTTLTRWGWVKGDDSSQDEKKDDFQEE